MMPPNGFFNAKFHQNMKKKKKKRQYFLLQYFENNGQNMRILGHIWTLLLSW
jgi:hypothetical protein